MRKKSIPLVIPINEELLLRSWKYEDAKSLAELANDQSIYDHLRDYFPHPYTILDAKAFIASVNPPASPSIFFAIEYRGYVAGSIGIYFKSDIYKSLAEVGYWIGKPYRNLGLATKAIIACCDYTFRFFPIHKIYAEVFNFNKASLQALKNAGFHEEAVLVEHGQKNGQFIDIVLCAKFNSLPPLQ